MSDLVGDDRTATWILCSSLVWWIKWWWSCCVKKPTLMDRQFTSQLNAHSDQWIQRVRSDLMQSEARLQGLRAAILTACADLSQLIPGWLVILGLASMSFQDFVVPGWPPCNPGISFHVILGFRHSGTRTEWHGSLPCRPRITDTNYSILGPHAK